MRGNKSLIKDRIWNHRQLLMTQQDKIEGKMSSLEGAEDDTKQERFKIPNWTEIWTKRENGGGNGGGNGNGNENDNDNNNNNDNTTTTTTNNPWVILGSEYSTESSITQQILARVWLTYRTGFEAIARAEDGPKPLSFIHSMVFNRNPMSTNIHSFIDNNNFTTDVGWGCMIRTSQMVLANAYQRLMINQGVDKKTIDQRLIYQFRDCSQAPFSLHNFIRVASELPLQVKPGQWFGPNAASLSIQRLCEHVDQVELPKLAVFISESSDLYDDKIEEIFGETCQGLLVLLPIRLGIDKTNEFYFSSIFELLNLPQAVGIAGGRPSSSFYFFGYDGDDLLYLDPHYPQLSLNNDINSYHTQTYHRLKINELDPSMMIGILINDVHDYNAFKTGCADNKIVHFHNTTIKLHSQHTRKVKTDDFVDIVDDDFDVDIEPMESLDKLSEPKSPEREPPEPVESMDPSEEGFEKVQPQAIDSSYQEVVREEIVEGRGESEVDPAVDQNKILPRS